MNTPNRISDLYDIFLSSDGVSIDSRTVKKNQLFFALKGENSDGHKYIEKAIDDGAKIAIIDNKEFQTKNTFLVDNVEKTLQSLASFHRKKFQIPVIALTGSNGKTTTKELLSAALSSKYNVLATSGNFNNHLGVPLTLLRLKDYHEIAIIEMGANHQGEIDFLCNIATPNFGLITNIGYAHLEGFGGIEGVRKGKTELYRFLQKVGGIIFYNEQDSKLTTSLPEGVKTEAYNQEHVTVINQFPSLTFEYKENTIHTLLTGQYNVINIIAALAVANYFRVPDEKAIKGIEAYIPENNRSQIKKTKTNTLILDAYNANPSSMHLSINNISKINDSRKILILGHMLELGEESKNLHHELYEYVHKFEWDEVFWVGKEFEPVVTNNDQYFENVDSLINEFVKNKLTEATILLKGSRGAKLEKLIPYL